MKGKKIMKEEKMKGKVKLLNAAQVAGGFNFGGLLKDIGKGIKGVAETGADIAKKGLELAASPEGQAAIITAAQVAKTIAVV
mmetsp:Transcript_5837/g.3323  ORF Transcript_5837/g.3323 Transcript_5837/m.3323 type:complete len:82 (+) Transcript_5837:65-310(+)